VGSGIRGTLAYIGVELPAAGEPLPRTVSAIIWGLIVNDVLEPPRLFAVLTLTPRLKKYLQGSKG
jgi:hypothetical protein